MQSKVSEKEVYQMYRACFGANKKVLLDILSMAGFFDEDLKTSEEIAVSMFGKKILRKCGFTHISNQENFVNKMFELGVPADEEKEERII